MLLSIIIPVHNNASTLQWCLQSIGHNDRLDDVEIILVDDGSTDNSSIIIPPMASSMNLGHWCIEHQNPRGAAAARNKGIQIARGRYLWFVDADDTIVPGAIDILRQVTTKLSNKTDLLRMGTLVLAHNYNPATTPEVDLSSTHKVSLSQLMRPRSGCLDHTTYLFRRQFLIENKIAYAEGHHLLEDSMMMLLALDKAQHIEENASLRLYRHHQLGNSSTQGEWTNNMSPLFVDDTILFFNQLRSWLNKHLDNEKAEAFWTRYVEVYLRVLPVKCIPWHEVKRFRDAIFISDNPSYHPKSLIGRILSHKSIHIAFAISCKVLRPIVKREHKN